MKPSGGKEQLVLSLEAERDEEERVVSSDVDGLWRDGTRRMGEPKKSRS